MKLTLNRLLIVIFVAASFPLRATDDAADLRTNFRIKLPAQPRPLPEPLPPGAPPGFKIRGTKGWAWTPDQYLAEIPYLAKFKLNFLMNCYISMFDIEHHESWQDGEANRWWEDLPPEKKLAYEHVVRSCQEHGIQFCFSMNPNLASRRAVNDGAPQSIAQLFTHYQWMQGLGVKWFNLALDDITQGTDAVTQARVANEIFHRLRAKDPEAQMIFCPTYYWGDGTGAKQQPYLQALARDLDNEMYVFWTGDAVVGKVTRQAAESFRRICGHRVFLWDNYPVNDGHPTMHLGPVVDRDPDLCDVLDGYVSNPMRTQNQINRIPLATCADYAYNPRNYDPMRSIGQAILMLADTPTQREVLRDLVETYPGMLLDPAPRKHTSYNAAREQMDRILALPQSHQAALAYIEHLQKLSAQLKREFIDRYSAEKDTLDADIHVGLQKLGARYP